MALMSRMRRLIALVKKWTSVLFGNLVEELEDKIRVLEEINEQLQALSTIDDLTGVLNRRGFMPELEHRLVEVTSFSNDKRHGGNRGFLNILLFIDLDRFKEVNDQAGHDVGDEMLREVSRSLSTELRHDDVLARIGGDEFVALVRVHDENLESVAERIRKAVERVSVEDKGKSWRVGASVGAATLHPDDTAEYVLKKADRRMYQAKNSD